MHSFGTKLLSIKQLQLKHVEQLFQLATQLKSSFMSTGDYGEHYHTDFSRRLVFLLFLEPSTRTRMSFESAVHRIGARCSSFSNLKSTSLVKGESVLDTIKTLEAMKPDLLVIRYPDSPMVDQHLAESPTPTISAGSGPFEHPTQALLDVFTVKEKLGNISGKNILFLGDVRHSRVANSNYHLFKLLGANIGYCAPSFYAPVAEQGWDHSTAFEKLKEGLEWADVCMVLRLQKERHSEKTDQRISEYVTYYQLNEKAMEWLSPQSYIMHPGPFVPNEEITYGAVNDSRSLILNQVENGVYVRSSLLINMLSGDSR
ncbi:MAG: aspartate carbamoyltransferase catalytic subunit [Bdellovibrionales bacterium]